MTKDAGGLGIPSQRGLDSLRCKNECGRTGLRIAPGDHKTKRRTAPHGAVVSLTFCVTHPFHPQVGREFEVVDRRCIRDQDLIFYQDASGCLRSISTSFTSMGVPDAAVVLGAGRSRFRVADLQALRRLMEDLGR